MKTDRVVRRFLVALCAIAAACSSSGPSTISYAGQWAGTTAQGESIAFTISSDQLVTAITLGYAFNGCTGLQTYSNLSLSIVPQVTCVPGPCPSSVSSYRQFSYQTGGAAQEPMTQVNGILFSGGSAQGSANFRDYPGCGTVVGVAWSATKR